MAERTQVSEESGRQVPSVSDLIDRLSRFDGPPEAFLINLLAVQCYIAAAGGGAILRMTGQGQVEVLAIYPQIEEGGRAPAWMAQSVEHAPGVLSSGATAIKPMRSPEDLYGAPPRMHLIMVPIKGAGNVRGVACFLVDTADDSTLNICRERLELTVSLLSLYEMRLTLQRRQLDLGRLRLAMDVLSAVNEHDRFAGAGMAFCNELASRLQCERVGLGFLKGSYVHLKALSHTEKFTRKMKLVQDIESAMEECLDQDVEVIFPATPEATYVSRSTKELSVKHGPSAVLSLPLRRAGEVVGVAIIERVTDRLFTLEEVEAMRLTCDLCTARLANLHESDRWVGARMAMSVRKGAALAIGPKHTWVKLLVIGLFALIMFLVFAKGDHDAEASFHFEATVQQTLSAPFDGYIEKAYVRPGDMVIANKTVLAKMETNELDQRLIQASSDYAEAKSDANKAISRPEDPNHTKMAEYQAALARMKKAQAQIDSFERQIREASITSPISGKMISNQDLTRQSRPHVKMGDALFEVAPVESLRAMLEVPEDEIAQVKDRLNYGDKADHGELATMAYPEKRIRFTVDRIYPVAEVVEQLNVFKVQVVLNADDVKQYGGDLWISPGAKGMAKIHLDKQPYAQLWTQKLINWVRMKLWI